MSNHLGKYIKARREQLGLGRSEVARRFGYDNVSMGSARLHSVEEGRWINRDFLQRLMGILQIEPQVVQDLIDRDREEYVAAWEQWANEPVPMTAAIRLIPGFIAGVHLPDDVTTPEQAVAWAVAMARQKNKKVFVVVSRRQSFTVHEDGRVDDIHATPDSNGMPWMALGKSPFLPSLGPSEKIKADERSRQ